MKYKLPVVILSLLGDFHEHSSGCNLPAVLVGVGPRENAVFGPTTENLVAGSTGVIQPVFVAGACGNTMQEVGGGG